MMDNWISCNVQMPELNVPVLTFDGHCYSVERRISYIDTEVGQIEGEWWIDGYEGDEFEPIGLRDGAAIAWHSLPEYPTIKTTDFEKSVSCMDMYHVRSKYDKYSKKHYLREIIDKYTGDVVHYLYFNHSPSWDEIVEEVKRLDALSDY